jgi:hypothetical protein
MPARAVGDQMINFHRPFLAARDVLWRGAKPAAIFVLFGTDGWRTLLRGKPCSSMRGQVIRGPVAPGRGAGRSLGQRLSMGWIGAFWSS